MADDLDVALDQLRDLLSDQLKSVDGLSTKVSVVLGFVLTASGALFGLKAEVVAAHQIAAGLSAVVLFLAATLLAIPLMATTYIDPPDPDWVLRILNNGRDLRPALIQSLSGACIQNHATIARHFQTFNGAIVLFVIGVAVFVFGVWIA